MNIYSCKFQDLYQRHLCRHSQYGNNIIHLATEIGTYTGLFTLALKLVNLFEGPPWLITLLPLPYLVMIAFSVPLRVLLACAAFIGLFLAAFLSMPELPLWLPIPLIVVCYFVQNWSHLLYTRAADMTEFNTRYPKGRTLFVLLLVFELPLLLNYLCFDPKSWVDVFPRITGVARPESAKGVASHTAV